MSPRYDRRLTENLSHPWRVHHYLDRPFSFFLSTSLHTDYHQNSYRSNHGICPNRPNPHTDFRIIEPYTPTAVHGSPKHTKGRKRRKRSGQELCLSLRNPDPDLIHSELLVFVIPVARKTESLAVETETLWRTQLLGGAHESITTSGPII
jgi:hypothetical protein